MIVQINDRWRIVSDPYQWIVQQYVGVYKSGRKMNQPKWKARKYMTTFPAAARKVAEMMIQESETHTESEALAVLERIATRMEAVLDKITTKAESVKCEK